MTYNEANLLHHYSNGSRKNRRKQRLRLFSTMDEIIETVIIGEYRYLSDLTGKLNLFERSFVLKQNIVLH